MLAVGRGKNGLNKWKKGGYWHGDLCYESDAADVSKALSLTKTGNAWGLFEPKVCSTWFRSSACGFVFVRPAQPLRGCALTVLAPLPVSGSWCSVEDRSWRPIQGRRRLLEFGRHFCIHSRGRSRLRNAPKNIRRHSQHRRTYDSMPPRCRALTLQ